MIESGFKSRQRKNVFFFFFKKKIIGPMGLLVLQDVHLIGPTTLPQKKYLIWKLTQPSIHPLTVSSHPPTAPATAYQVQASYYLFFQNFVSFSLQLHIS
jgi:hypothetical protein